VCRTDCMVNSGLVNVQIVPAVFVKVSVCVGTDSTVNIGLLTVQNVTTYLVKVSVSVWN
jgi:hypothetical protein